MPNYRCPNQQRSVLKSALFLAAGAMLFFALLAIQQALGANVTLRIHQYFKETALYWFVLRVCLMGAFLFYFPSLLRCSARFQLLPSSKQRSLQQLRWRIALWFVFFEVLFETPLLQIITDFLSK